MTSGWVRVATQYPSFHHTTSMYLRPKALRRNSTDNAYVAVSDHHGAEANDMPMPTAPTPIAGLPQQLVVVAADLNSARRSGPGLPSR